MTPAALRRGVRKERVGTGILQEDLPAQPLPILEAYPPCQTSKSPPPISTTDHRLAKGPLAELGMPKSREPSLYAVLSGAKDNKTWPPPYQCA